MKEDGFPLFTPKKIKEKDRKRKESENKEDGCTPTKELWIYYGWYVSKLSLKAHLTSLPSLYVELDFNNFRDGRC